MNLPHIIRIRGPWKRIVLEREEGGDIPEPRSVTMPAGWEGDLGAEFRGRVEYRRFFNCPTSITDSTEMRLVFVKVVGRSAIHLNETEIGKVDWPDTSVAIEVTGKLQRRNEIVVTIDSLADAEPAANMSLGQSLPEGGLVGEVRLEIG